MTVGISLFTLGIFFLTLCCAPVLSCPLSTSPCDPDSLCLSPFLCGFSPVPLWLPLTSPLHLGTHLSSLYPCLSCCILLPACPGHFWSFRSHLLPISSFSGFSGQPLGSPKSLGILPFSLVGPPGVPPGGPPFCLLAVTCGSHFHPERGGSQALVPALGPTNSPQRGGPDTPGPCPLLGILLPPVVIPSSFFLQHSVYTSSLDTLACEYQLTWYSTDAFPL